MISPYEQSYNKQKTIYRNTEFMIHVCKLCFPSRVQSYRERCLSLKKANTTGNLSKLSSSP